MKNWNVRGAKSLPVLIVPRRPCRSIAGTTPRIISRTTSPAPSYAYRLKPHAIDVRLQVDPVQWFLLGKDDVRSSFYLEDAATEYRVQGLELDWACVTWDADFRRVGTSWSHHKFVGDSWSRVHKLERQKYIKNAYRVLLTRARQGMVIVVPNGEIADHTRKREYYDPTFEYLSSIGFGTI